MDVTISHSDIIMYIVINTDLKMRKGRIAAQVGHIVQVITEEIVRDSYETIPIPPHCLTYMKWKRKCTKVILGATEQQLSALIHHPEARYFIDTTIDNETPRLTTVGFFPSSIITPELIHLKLI